MQKVVEFLQKNPEVEVFQYLLLNTHGFAFMVKAVFEEQ